MTLSYRYLRPQRTAALLSSRWVEPITRWLLDYRLTSAFLVISAVVLFSAAHVIASIAGRSAENGIVSMLQRQSERDSLVFARLVSRAMSSDLTEIEATDARQLAAELLDASDVLRISLHGSAGEPIWSSGMSDWVSGPPEDDALGLAMSGETNTVLLKRVNVTTDESHGARLDIVESFVPIVDIATGEPVLILAIARDATSTLAEQAALTRSELYRSILTTMAVGFAILLLLVATIDISLRRAREREMLQGMAMARMDIVNSELQRANRERSRFVAMISHELKTPLTSILAFSEILSRRLDRVDAFKREGEFVEVIRRNGAHLQRLITDLLDASRLQASQLGVEPVEFDLGQMIREATVSMAPMFEAKGQSLRTDICLADVIATADRDRLIQVIGNLLTNASKYTPEGSIVKLSASMTQNVLSITVKDNGPGIPREQQGDLFRPFYRVDNDLTRGQSGTGLGLAIVKAIAEGHGGVVELRSEPGFGTEVICRIPLGMANTETGHAAESPDAEQGQATAAPRAKEVIAAIRRLRASA